MTTHYTIQLTNYKIDFKATYRDGKFRKLEHLRGRMNQSLMDSLGKVIPQLESELETFIKKFAGRVSYTKEAGGQKTEFSKFLSAWYQFYRKENNNLDPKHAGAETNALKAIIVYLKKINNGDETAALANWNLLLNSWDSLSEFHQKQMDLKYINSKLNVIIREIIRENGVNTTGDNSSVSI
jgi:hypothetical protein